MTISSCSLAEQLKLDGYMNNLTIKDLKSLRKSEFPNGESTSEQAEKNRKTGEIEIPPSQRPPGGRTNQGEPLPRRLRARLHQFISLFLSSSSPEGRRHRKRGERAAEELEVLRVALSRRGQTSSRSSLTNPTRVRVQGFPVSL